MRYLSALKFDTLSHWSKDELAFYEQRNFPFTNDLSLKHVHKDIVSLIDQNTHLKFAMVGIGYQSFEVFRHWFTVV